MGRKKEVIEEAPADPTAWILDNELASFLLMHTNEIKYMCMLGYTYMHGSKVFKTFTPTTPFSFKFVSMVMACTGGGILVPIFINSIPVPLCQDAYPVAILTSFLVHSYCPVLREVLDISPVFKAAIVFLYETLRAFVVVKLTTAAGAAIPASEFPFPIFGPIFCGTIAGCGGAFLPLNKGLDPIKKGLAPPMYSAFVAATFFHLFTNLVSEDVQDAPRKAHVAVSIGFVLYGFYTNGVFFGKAAAPAAATKTPAKKTKGQIKKES